MEKYDRINNIDLNLIINKGDGNMPTLFVITGPAGVGKSTISKKVAESKSKSAMIEGDEIYHQVVGSYQSPWKEGNHLDVFWEICINTINTYLENDYDVIFNYIVGLENLEIIKQKFSKYDTKFVVLMVDEETLLKRDKERPLDWQMGERCIELLNSFKSKGYDNKNMLDTSNITVEETAKIILNEEIFNI